MNWKRIVIFATSVLVVSVISSASTWYFLTGQKKLAPQISWKKLLNLSEEQQTKFAKLESELESVLKGLELDDAQNKIYLCSYLDRFNKTPREMKSATHKMAESYQKKQEKIAGTLLAISQILTPEQRKTFSKRLMHQVCLSCRKSTGTDKCLCGMCGL